MVAKKKSIKKKISSKKETKPGTNKSSSTSKVKKNIKGKVKTKAKPKAKIKTKAITKIKTKAKPKAKAKAKIKTKAITKIKTEVKKQTKRPQPKTIKSKKIETDPSTSKIRDHLEANQQELLNIIQSNQSAERKTSESNFSNEIDMASDLEGREMMFQLTSRDRNELKKIREAIYKIDHGTYGICESCLKKISSKRLKILPLSNLCIDCKEAMEQAL